MQIETQLGVVVHTYNPSNGRPRQEHEELRPVWATNKMNNKVKEI